MSLCGRIVVVEKTKRKRKRGSNDNDETNHHYDDDDINDDDEGDEDEGDDDDDSINPLSYTYTNCDSIEILQEQEQLEQQQSFQSQQPLSFNNVLPVITKGGELDHKNDNDESTLGSLQELPQFQWLTWRMDPFKSFSDWIIDVTVPKLQRQLQQKRKRSRRKLTGTLHDNVSIQRYHVHRNILVLESQFFQSLFYNPNQQIKQAQQQTNDSNKVISYKYTAPIVAKSNVTEITLSNEYEANVFPTFLDYMYNPSSSWITQQNAITMLLLSKHFGMKRLQWLAKHSFKQQHSSLPINTTTARQQNEQKASNAIKQVSGAKVVSPKLSSFTQKVNYSRNPGVSSSADNKNKYRNINHNSNNDVTTTTSTSATATTTNFTIEVLDYDAATAPVPSTLDEQLVVDDDHYLEPIPLSNIQNPTSQHPNPKYHHRHISSINAAIERSNSLPTYNAQHSFYFGQTQQQQQEPLYDQHYPQHHSATAAATSTTTTNTTIVGVYSTATANSASTTTSSNNSNNNNRGNTKRTSSNKSVPEIIFQNI